MKKIILIDSNTGNSHFTLDPFWAGLVQLYGPDNVIDWPPAEKHREGLPKYVGDKEKDWGAERRSMCYTSCYDKLHVYSASQINIMAAQNEIQCVFVDERERSYVNYLKTNLRFYDIPVIVIAGLDRFDNVSLDVVRQYYGKNLRAMFLDNWRSEYNGLKNVYPMNYSLNCDHLWDVSKRENLLNNKLYNLCFMGYNSHPDRKLITEHLLQKYGTDGNCLFVEQRPDTFNRFLRKKDYFEAIAQSRVCINLRGAAECGKALRFYEIPYVGSYMLSQTFGGKQMNPMVDGEHCHYFNTLDELDQKIEWALNNPEKREQIAAAGHTHNKIFDSSHHRVYQVMRKVFP